MEKTSKDDSKIFVEQFRKEWHLSEIEKTMRKKALWEQQELTVA